MATKENIDLTGKLCKFRNINVLIVGMCEKNLSFLKILTLTWTNILGITPYFLAEVLM